MVKRIILMEVRKIMTEWPQLESQSDDFPDFMRWGQTDTSLDSRYLDIWRIHVFKKVMFFVEDIWIII